MKACLDCGAEAPNGQLQCDACGRPTAWRIISRDEEAFAERRVTALGSGSDVRPDGRPAIGSGATAIALGVLCVLISFAINPYEHGEVNPGALRWQWGLLFFGAGIAQVGLIVWLAGYVVRAISFLPGRED